MVGGELHADGAPWSSVQMTCSGLRISTSELASMSPALTARAFLLQHHALGAFGVHAQRDLLDVEDDVGHVLAHAGDRGELVQHAVDLHGGDGRALQRGQQHAAQRVAERHAEAALQRLGDDGRDLAAVAAGRRPRACSA